MVIVMIISTIVASQGMWQMVNVHVTAGMPVTGDCTTCHDNQTQSDLFEN